MTGEHDVGSLYAQCDWRQTALPVEKSRRRMFDHGGEVNPVHMI